MKSAWTMIVVLGTGCYLSHGDPDEDGGDDSRRADDSVGTDDIARLEDSGIPDTHGDDGGADPGDADGDGREARDDGHAVDGGDITEPPCVDEDGDGHPSVACGGDDCNDGDPSIYPGAPDTCADGLDTNCDGLDPREGPVGPRVLLLEHPHTAGSLYTALVWTGREYLFLWRIFAGEGIFLRRVDGAGKLLGDEVRIRTYENAFDIAWNGSRVGAVWAAGEEGSESVMFQAFDHLGNPLTIPVAIVTSPHIGLDGSTAYGPRIAAAGDDFFVLWSEHISDSDESRVRLVRIDGEGGRRMEPVQVGSYFGGDGPKLELAWSGTELLVSWTSDGHERYTMETTLLLRPFSLDAAPLGAERLVVDDAPYGTTPQLLWNGADYILLWSQTDAPMSPAPVLASRRDAMGAELDTVTLDLPLLGYYPSWRPAVWGRDRLTVLWNGSTDAGHDLRLRRFEPSGALHGSTITIPTPVWPGQLYLLWTAGEYGFIWSEQGEDFGYRVWFQRATFCD
jgi:hypothetical protein